MGLIPVVLNTTPFAHNNQSYITFRAVGFECVFFDDGFLRSFSHLGWRQVRVSLFSDGRTLLLVCPPEKRSAVSRVVLQDGFD